MSYSGRPKTGPSEVKAIFSFRPLQGRGPAASDATSEGSASRAIGPWIAALLVVALSAALRFHGLGDEPLWLDEAYSWWDARQSLGTLWSLVPHCDPHPPLYFVLLKGWVALFGDEAEALRALSALIGVGTTIVIVAAGRIISPTVGWVAGLMYALTPFQIEFAHEARPYALLCFGASLLVYGALRVLRGRQQLASTFDRGWVALGLGAALVLWSNNTSAFLVGAICLVFAAVFWLDRGTRRALPAFVVAMAVGVLLWLPFVPVMLAQAREVTSDFWIQPPTPGWRVINELRFVVSLSVYEAFWGGIALAALGLVMLWRRGYRREAAVVFGLAVLPALLNYAVSMTVKPVFLSRALIGIAPAMVIAGACAVGLMSRVAMRNLAVALLAATHVAAIIGQRQAYQGKEPWDEIAQQVTQGAVVGMAGYETPMMDASGSIVLVAANELALPLEHALRELELQVPLRGAPMDFPAPGLNARYPSGKCAPQVRNQDMASIARAVQGRRVVWFVTRRKNVYDPDNAIVKLLSLQGWREVETRRFMPGWLEVHKFVSSVPVRAAREAHARR